MNWHNVFMFLAGISLWISGTLGIGGGIVWLTEPSKVAMWITLISLAVFILTGSLAMGLFT